VVLQVVVILVVGWEREASASNEKPWDHKIQE
jgi:hypothetical protein